MLLSLRGNIIPVGRRETRKEKEENGWKVKLEKKLVSNMFLFDEEGGTNGKISDLEAWEKPIRFHPPPRKKYVLTLTRVYLKNFPSD